MLTAAACVLNTAWMLERKALYKWNNDDHDDDLTYVWTYIEPRIKKPQGHQWNTDACARLLLATDWQMCDEQRKNRWVLLLTEGKVCVLQWMRLLLIREFRRVVNLSKKKNTIIGLIQWEPDARRRHGGTKMLYYTHRINDRYKNTTKKNRGWLKRPAPDVNYNQSLQVETRKLCPLGREKSRECSFSCYMRGTGVSSLEGGTLHTNKVKTAT